VTLAGKPVCRNLGKDIQGSRKRVQRMREDVIILGAGAAGLCCAAVAAGRGRSVVVLDHGTKPGRKVLASVAGGAIAPM
jgi:glycine/D-amino acid oxidase-like deaminating enzyme